MLFGCQMFRSSGAWLVWVVVVYKHLVPLGPKTTATKIQTVWYTNFSVSALVILYESQSRFAAGDGDRRPGDERRPIG